MTIAVIICAPNTEPIRAYVAVISRSCESNESAGIIDQIATSFAE